MTETFCLDERRVPYFPLLGTGYMLSSPRPAARFPDHCIGGGLAPLHLPKEEAENEKQANAPRISTRIGNC